MAQDFASYSAHQISTGYTEFPTSTTFTTNDTIIGMHIANTSTNAINVTVVINNGTQDVPLLELAPIPSGGALQVNDGGAKIVVQNGHRLKIKSSVANSASAWISVVSDIDGQ
jgi:hypothetical protein